MSIARFVRRLWPRRKDRRVFTSILRDFAPAGSTRKELASAPGPASVSGTEGLCYECRMAPRVHHLAVVVRDLDAAERFYAGVLGLPLLRRWQDAEGRPRSLWLELGHGAFLALERAAATMPLRSDESPGFHCVAFAITPAEREVYRARLATAGIPVERETAYTLYVRDPDKNLVGFSHHPEEAGSSRPTAAR
jgi:glyoxylase I family protein